MLSSLRSMSQGIVAKILLVFLMLSFAVWGIGDIFQGGSQSAVATVEGNKITVSELNALISRLEQNYPEITADVATDPAFRAEVLNNLINDELLRLEGEALGLSFSQDALAKVTARNPMFQKAGGGFDRNLFLLTLQQNNHTEQSYLARMRNELAASMIQDTLKLSIAPPQDMLTLYHQIRNERREARLVLVQQADAGAIPQPSDDDLKTLYERNGEQYMEPERRSLRTVQFDAAKIWDLLDLKADEEALRSLYEERKEEFAEEEKRDISQLVFSSEDKAREIAALISEGTSFHDAAKDKRVLNGGSTSVGEVTRVSLPDEVVDTVFSLPEKGISAPVESSFGWHIFAVNKVIEPRTPPYEEVQGKLQETYRAEHTEEKINELGNALEDALAAGTTLEDALQQVGLGELDIQQLGPISATNTLPDGSTRTLDKTQQEMLQLGFGLNEGQTSNLALTSENDYYLVQVSAITPAELKPFASVRSEIYQSYMEAARASALKKKAEAVAKRLGEAESPDAALKADGINTVSSGKLTRMDDTINQGPLKNKILTGGFTTELFRLKKGRVTGAYPLPSGEYMIGILDAIHPAQAATDKDLSSLRTELEIMLPEEFVQLMLAYLRTKYDVSINDKLLFESQSAE